jgi:excisionase family DNA binding protein
MQAYLRTSQIGINVLLTTSKWLVAVTQGVVMTADSQLLFTPEQAAAKLAAGRTTIYALMASGELQSVKIGRSRRIPSVALKEYVGKLKGTQAWALESDEGRHWQTGPHTIRPPPQRSMA